MTQWNQLQKRKKMMKFACFAMNFTQNPKQKKAGFSVMFVETGPTKLAQMQKKMMTHLRVTFVHKYNAYFNSNV